MGKIIQHFIRENVGRLEMHAKRPKGACILCMHERAAENEHISMTFKKKKYTKMDALVTEKKSESQFEVTFCSIQ